MLPLRKYRPFSTQNNKLSGHRSSFYTWLAKKAWLNLFRSLKSSPPSVFGVVIFFHETHDILCFSVVDPHQKRAIRLSISEHNSIGSWKQFIEYTGIAKATCLMRVSFPAVERNFVCHPFIFLNTFSLMYWNISFFLSTRLFW